MRGFIHKYWLLTFIALLPFAIYSQNNKVITGDSTFNASKNYINDYYNTKTQTKDDSLFLLNIKHLNWYIQNDTLYQQYQAIRNVIDQNRSAYHLKIIQNHFDSIVAKKQLYDSLRKDYVQFELLLEQLDTVTVSSTDSNFMNILDVVMNDSLIDDSEHEMDSIELELYSKYYQNDTLIKAIRNIIKQYEGNDFLQWVKTMRRDTFDFYIIDLEGDSVKITLFDANFDLIKFQITDYWGSTINAIIRDINSNSFKILVDDTPNLEIETSEKAIKAIEKLNKRNKQKQLTIKKIEIEALEDTWQIYGNTHLDFSQVGMYQWAQGGEPSVSFLAGFELFTKYKKKNHQWDSHIRLGYGIIRQGRYQDTSERMLPNEDRIELNTKYGIKAIRQTNITIEGDFKSQFAPQHEWDNATKKAKLSSFMSPGYVTFSLGFDYNKIKNLKLFAAPASSRTTFVIDTANSIKNRYSVDSNKLYRSEFGFRVQASHSFKVWNNIVVNNRLELFSNYLYKPKNIDINWELNLTFPVNEYLRASFSSHLIYDDDQNVPKYHWGSVSHGDGSTSMEWIKTEGPGLQFKETLKLGLVFIF